MIFPTKDSRGMILRLFDTEREEWSIYWADSRTGVLGPPVIGTFADDRGDFCGDDTHDGQPVKVHFGWSEISAKSARWEQEFSADDGRSWDQLDHGVHRAKPQAAVTAGLWPGQPACSGPAIQGLLTVRRR